MSRSPLLQWLMTGLLAWALLQVALRHLGWAAVLTMTAVAAAAAAVAWLAVYDRPRLAWVSARPGCRPVVDFLCRSLQVQPATAPAADSEGEPAPDPELMLAEPADFDRAAEALKSVVRGHDAAIDALVAALRQKVLVRTRSRSDAAAGPLAAFVLAGPEGIGKRQLAGRIGQLIYKRRSVAYFDLSEHRDEAAAVADLFGSDGSVGRLTSAVRREPRHTLVLDRLDVAPAAVLDRLAKLLAHGRWQPAGAGSAVDFRHCVFHLLVRCEPIPPTQDLRAAVAEETPLGPALAIRADEVVAMGRLDRRQKADVLALLMERHCRRHGVALGRIAPSVLAEEVAAISDAHGFSLAPDRITRRLLGPLARAAQTGAPQIDVEADPSRTGDPA